MAKGDKVIVLDVTVPFENRQEALDRARQEKEDKYGPLKTSLGTRYREVKIAPVVVGALGTWDPRNDKYLRGLSTRAYFRKMKRLVICETLSWSRCMYMEHLSGRIQRPHRWDRPAGNQQEEEPAADEPLSQAQMSPVQVGREDVACVRRLRREREDPLEEEEGRRRTEEEEGRRRGHNNENDNTLNVQESDLD